MDSRTQRASGTVVDPRTSLAIWLRQGRAQRNLTLDDVARITKIQPRILEKLESGQLDGLPAEVFVRGFVRSFAKCVGLPESEAIERYGAAQVGHATTVAKALVETMSPTVRLVSPKATPREPEALGEAAPEVLPASSAQIARVVETAPVIVPVQAAPVVATPAVIEGAAVAPVMAMPAVTPVAPVVATPAVIEGAAVAPVVESPAAVEAPLLVEAAPVVEADAPAKKKRTRKKSTTAAPRARKKKTTAAPIVEATVAPAVEPAVVEPTVVEAAVAPAVVEAVASAVVEAVASAVVEAAVAPAVVEAAVVPVVEAAAAPAVVEAAAIEPVTLDGSVDRTAAITDGDERVTFDDAAIATTPFVRASIDDGDALSADLEELKAAAAFATSLTSEYEIELVFEDGTVEAPQLAEGSQRISSSDIEAELHSGTWQPTMPPIASTPSVPWRRPRLPAQTAYVVPTLVIDDADPESADREREARASRDQSRLSFLPPILLDREDRSARQGGLTLAVIILLIAATLTLSYLMRRPSPSGDGVTMLDGSAQLYS